MRSVVASLYVAIAGQADLTKSPLSLEAKLLSGEIVVNEASFVRKCIGTDSSQDDLWGKLICTNFKISFITQDPSPRQKFHYVNRLLGEHDIPLACVEQVVTGEALGPVLSPL